MHKMPVEKHYLPSCRRHGSPARRACPLPGKRLCLPCRQVRL